MKIKKTGIIKNPMKTKEFINHVHNGVKQLAMDCENHAKEIISDKSVDTGEFLNSIWTKTFIKGTKISFTMYDGVKYGIFWEKGTKLHWVPFYKYIGQAFGHAMYDPSQPILADWGHRVLGLSQEEMLKMGGMKVKIPALMPFLRSLLFIEGTAPEEFEKLEKEFRKRIKHGTQ